MNGARVRKRWKRRDLAVPALASGAAILASGILGAGSGSAVTSAAASGSLALATNSSLPGPGLYRLDLGSRGLTRLTRGGSDGWPAWSRDGKRIAFIRAPSRRPRLYVVNRDGSGLQAVGQVTATSASWGPGDRQIAIGRGKGIWVVRPDGTGLRRLYAPRGGAAVDQPAWSPDGRTILFRQASSIYGIRADGSGAHAIVTAPKPSARHLYQLSAPAWSPSGKRISFVQIDLLGPLTASRSWIKIANPDGSGERTVTRPSVGYTPDSGAPAWSPDSSLIAFGDLRGKQQGVFEVPSGGGKPRLLYGGSSGTIWSQPSWAPAGA